MADEHNGLAYRAMLSTVEIKRWGGRKADHVLAEGVAANTGGDALAFGVTKRLVGKDFTRGVNGIYSAARESWVSHTVEWSGSQRLLPNKHLEWFESAMAHYETRFNEEVDALVANFGRAIEAAARDQGEAFDPEDYPDHSRLRSAYQFSWSVNVVPETDDIRANVDPEVADRLRAQGRKARDGAAAAASRDVIDRLGEVLGRMVKVFAEDNGKGAKPRINSSLMDDIDVAADRMKGLNVMDDPTVGDAIEQFRRRFANMRADELRSDPGLREQKRKEAEDMAKKFAMMGG